MVDQNNSHKKFTKKFILFQKHYPCGNLMLSNLGQVTSTCVYKLGQHWFKFWFVTSSMTIHYLANAGLLLILGTNSAQFNTAYWDSLRKWISNIFCKMAAILPWPQCATSLISRSGKIKISTRLVSLLYLSFLHCKGLLKRDVLHTTTWHLLFAPVCFCPWNFKSRTQKTQTNCQISCTSIHSERLHWKPCLKRHYRLAIALKACIHMFTEYMYFSIPNTSFHVKSFWSRWTIGILFT